MRIFAAFVFVAALVLVVLAPGCSSCGANPAQATAPCGTAGDMYEVPVYNDAAAAAGACGVAASCATAPAPTGAPLRLSMASLDPCTRAQLNAGGRIMAVRGRVDGAAFARAGFSVPPKILMCATVAAGKIVSAVVEGVQCALQGVIDWLNPQPTFTLVLIPAEAAATKSACAPLQKTATPCDPPPKAATPCDPIPAAKPN